MPSRPASSPWLLPFKWSSVGFLAGAASVGVAWGTLGGRVEQQTPEPRGEVILSHRESTAPTRAAPDAGITPPASTEPEPQTASAQPEPTDTALAGAPQADPAPEVPKFADPATLAASPVLRINVNSASLEELDLLPGIGPALAQRIIDERTRTGRFVSLNDLQRVRGIGPKTVEKLQGLVVFE